MLSIQIDTKIQKLFQDGKNLCSTLLLKAAGEPVKAPMLAFGLPALFPPNPVVNKIFMIRLTFYSKDATLLSLTMWLKKTPFYTILKVD